MATIAPHRITALVSREHLFCGIAYDAHYLRGIISAPSTNATALGTNRQHQTACASSQTSSAKRRTINVVGDKRYRGINIATLNALKCQSGIATSGVAWATMFDDDGERVVGMMPIIGMLTGSVVGGIVLNVDPSRAAHLPLPLLPRASLPASAAYLPTGLPSPATACHASRLLLPAIPCLPACLLPPASLPITHTYRAGDATYSIKRGAITPSVRIICRRQY